MNTVVVTGAGGYIGGQTAISFKDAGYRVVGIDCVHPPQHLSESTFFDKFLVSNFYSEDSINLIVNEKPDAIVHCAGTSLVGPSIKNPSVYYENNFVGTKILLDAVLQHNLKTRIIFSSSAATYGEPLLTPINEVDPQLPCNPYGQSKLMVEMMLESYHVAYGLDYVGFRYFNVCGADSQTRHGQAPGATHLIARILEAIRNKETFYLNGTDFPTLDGTCVRDYVHVQDIAKAHTYAVQHATKGFYNLSSGEGYSNKQIIDTAFEVVGETIDIVKGPARPGDPAILNGSYEKFNNEAGWAPEHNLEKIVSHAWAWYNR